MNKTSINKEGCLPTLFNHYFHLKLLTHNSSRALHRLDGWSHVRGGFGERIKGRWTTQCWRSSMIMPVAMTFAAADALKWARTIRTKGTCMQEFVPKKLVSTLGRINGACHANISVARTRRRLHLSVQWRVRRICLAWRPVSEAILR